MAGKCNEARPRFLPLSPVHRHRSVGMGNTGLGFELKRVERKRTAGLVFNDFPVKLLQGRLRLFDVF